MTIIKDYILPTLVLLCLILGTIMGTLTLRSCTFPEKPQTPSAQVIEDNKKISEAQTILLSRCIERLKWTQDICDYEAEAARRVK